MSDLIDRQVLREDTEKIYKYDCQTFVVHYAQVIDDKSSTEPERKKGEWIEDKTGYGYWTCSRCGFVTEASAANILYHFCPNCGASMRGEHEL